MIRSSEGVQYVFRISTIFVILTSCSFDRVLAQEPCSPWATGQQQIATDVQAFYGSQNCDGEPLLNVVVAARGTPYWFTHSFDPADLEKYQPGGEIYEEVEEWREEFAREIEAQKGHPGGVLLPDLLWGIAWFWSDQRLRLMYGKEPPEYSVLKEFDVPSPQEGALVVLVEDVDGTPEVVGTFLHPRITVEGIEPSRAQVAEVRATGQLPADFDPVAALQTVISADPVGSGFLRR
jgi:hypothetical protein